MSDKQLPECVRGAGQEQQPVPKVLVPLLFLTPQELSQDLRVRDLDQDLEQDRDPEETPVRIQDQTSAAVMNPLNQSNTKICVYPNKPTDAPRAKRANTPKGEYPVDMFSLEQRRQGWIILHLFGMMYVFLALAIVCDEFFVLTLEIITEKLRITEDAAGATFMAAGGSAPELFTSLIGVFISHTNVGIGTIVGSAVFNILFVIGMCAVFSRGVLSLTWWPLFRDMSFYVLYLIMLIVFFLDNSIQWWESVLLLLGYAAYLTFMKFNVQAETAVKVCCKRRKNRAVGSTNESDKESVGQSVSQMCPYFFLVNRWPDLLLLFLMLNPGPYLGQTPRWTHLKPRSQRKGMMEMQRRRVPQTRPKQAKYLFQLPILLLLCVTLPNVRKPAWWKFFAVTFIGSILWIATFSYFMVWWAHQVGETVGISDEIMGLTILAVGTSIPDLITSVIVARKGLGDMAVSSSVGSNIFYITVGLPFPWLLSSLTHGGEAVLVSSNGLFCAIVMLFLMLLFIIMSIVVCRWKMNHTLGLMMFVLYFLFLLFSVLLENHMIPCPVFI
ncbi:sodium/potassium/calcium exchanger 1-like [Boleophthalmus pectinirostris]|uniref:sodium/potassium/calcium exchanger 1-like n=1 Tax=Boleophthalmus pectinirostris TaxID=150288 RepID=UPI00242D7952|nr:sodium/potassium/calcium exchanger 1-like [Boleophthalmus pectinirostris]